MESRARAEALWEELGGDLCVCQQPDVPHWCERCQRRIDLIQSALKRAADLSEVCICAAVQTEEGLVIRGHRHHDALRAAQLAFCTPLRGEDAQGFITSRGRYVTREEGYQLQVAAGVGSKNGYRGERLYSEDLY